MPKNEEIPDLPEDLATAKQFGRFLALLRMRAERTQLSVANATLRAAHSRSPDAPRPLTTQRISKMENPDGTLPSSEELRSYLYGCGKLDQFARLEAVRRRLQQSLLDADRARESGSKRGDPETASGTQAARASLPVPVAPAGLPAEEGFSGRSDTLALLGDALNPNSGDSTPGVITVSGLPGVGKTSLVLRAARRAMAAGWFAGGVLFVDLRGYDPAGAVEPHAALAAMLGALGVPGERIPHTQGEREALYRSQLAAMAAKEQRVLVVADNASNVQQIVALRPGSPLHRMISTSRETLPVHGARRVELEVLSEDEALAVVAMAVNAAHPGDARIAAEPDASAALARLCDYLPLALRIAAQLLADKPRQPVSDLVDLLATTQDRLSELAYGDSEGVRVTFEASYQRLSARHAELFRLAALHPGQFFGLDALAAITDAPRDVTRRLAEELRRAHLFQPAPERDAYRFHDLVRLFALERCESDETQAARDAATGRLLTYYGDTTREAGGLFDPRAEPPEGPVRFPDEASAGAWLEAERANLVAVINTAAGLGRDEYVADTALALRFFFNRRKFWDDWIATGTRAVDATRRLGDQSRVSVALNSLGVAYFDLHRFDEALACSRQVLAISRELGDRRGEAMALVNHGGIYHGQGKPEEAIESFKQAVPILREIHDSYTLGQAINNIAFVLDELGKPDEAILHYQQSLDLFRTLKDQTTVGVTSTNLGAVYQKLGRWDEALRHHELALAIFEGSDDRLHEARTLNNLGVTYQKMGIPDEAVAYHERALAICQAIRDTHGEATTLSDLGIVYESMDRPTDALSCFEKALTLFIQVSATGDAERTRAHIAKLTGQEP
jgi:tetratricopeptide (TPR) repeat protein